MEVGEGFAGDGANAAHINTLLGRRDGPVGTAFATALATPSPGHVPFLAVWAPNVPLQPPTLFVNKATIAGDRHGTLTWGAAQAGVAAGVSKAIAARFDSASLAHLVLIVAVWVNPEAGASVNSSDATDASARSALAAFRTGQSPTNPYFRSGAISRP
jgi:5,6,7,8-tetrahydromethanopterin hydro-lyase